MRTLDDAAKDLLRALKTLDPQQGRIARRNARLRALGALNECRRRLDEEYPAIKLPREPAKRRSLAARRKELIDDGWVATEDHDLLSVVAAQKLPLRRTPAGWLREPQTYPGGTQPMTGSGLKAPSQTWVPGWVAHYYSTVEPRQRVPKLNEARHNPKMIQAAKAAVRLGSLDAAIKGNVVVIPVR